MKCEYCNYVNEYFLFDNLKYEKSERGFLSIKEEIFSYNCSICKNKNILKTNVLDSNYSLNLLLWKKMNYKIINVNIPNYLCPKTLNNYLYYDLDFILLKKNGNFLYESKIVNKLEIRNYYIAVFKDPIKKMEKLNIFYFDKTSAKAKEHSSRNNK